MFTKAEQRDCHEDNSLLALSGTFLGLWLDFHVGSTCLDPGRTYVLCETRFRDTSQGYAPRKPGNYGLAVGGGLVVVAAAPDSHHPLQYRRARGCALSYSDLGQQQTAACSAQPSTFSR